MDISTGHEPGSGLEKERAIQIRDKMGKPVGYVSSLDLKDCRVVLKGCNPGLYYIERKLGDATKSLSYWWDGKELDPERGSFEHDIAQAFKATGVRGEFGDRFHEDPSAKKIEDTIRSLYQQIGVVSGRNSLSMKRALAALIETFGPIPTQKELADAMPSGNVLKEARFLPSGYRE